MALNGVVKTGTSWHGGYCELTWSASQNSSSNTSTINWTFRGRGPDSGSYEVIKYWYVKLNGQTVHTKDYRDGAMGIAVGEPLQDIRPNLGSGSLVLSHNASGFLTLNVEIYAEIYNYSGTLTANESFELNPLYRTSTVRATNADVGSQTTITINRASSAYTHTLIYSFEGTSGTLVTKTTSTSYRWTIPTSFYNLMANKKSATCSITCQTYYNTSTYVGSSATSITISVPTTSIPRLNPNVTDVNSVTVALTGDPSTFIRYKSTAAFTIGASAQNGATITSQSARCSDGQLSFEPSGQFLEVGSGTFSFTATDSRDMINSVVIERPMINYIRLTCNMSNDIPRIDGKYDFDISGNYYQGSFGTKSNSLTVEYRYKIRDASSWGAWTKATPTVKDNAYTARVSLTGLNYRNVYVFECRATDVFGPITTGEHAVKSLPVFDWSDSDFNFNVPVTLTDVEETGKVYNLMDMVRGFQEISDDTFAQITGLAKAMSQRYELTCYVGKSTYYSSASVSMYLYGNTIRCYMTATRNSAVSGDIANELVCQVEFDSGGKVTGFGQVGFTSGVEGGIATFQMTDTYIYPNDGSVSPEQVGRGLFSIRLCAAATSDNMWNAYFVIPCTLDLSKF